MPFCTKLPGQLEIFILSVQLKINMDYNNPSKLSLLWLQQWSIINKAAIASQQLQCFNFIPISVPIKKTKQA